MQDRSGTTRNFPHYNTTLTTAPTGTPCFVPRRTRNGTNECRTVAELRGTRNSSQSLEQNYNEFYFELSRERETHVLSARLFIQNPANGKDLRPIREQLLLNRPIREQQ